MLNTTDEVLEDSPLEDDLTQSNNTSPNNSLDNLDDLQPPRKKRRREEPSTTRRSNQHRYIIVGKIGSGSYGDVYEAEDTDTGKVVALKKMRLPEDQQVGVPCTVIREVSLLKTISRHRNVVSLLDVIQETGKLYLIMEYVEQDLSNYLHRVSKPLSPALIKSFMYQLLSGIAHCHCHRVMHRDLKPQNILIDKTGVVKLADFGLARSFGLPLRQLTHEVVTLWYRAPEILLGAPRYSLAIDVWALGCIFAELVTRRPLFPGDSEIDQIYKIFHLMGTPTDRMWPGVTTMKDFQASFPVWRPQRLEEHVPTLCANGVELLKRMLTYDPARRITAKEALNHPYFSDFDRNVSTESS